jgi:hypothetical protein
MASNVTLSNARDAAIAKRARLDGHSITRSRPSLSLQRTSAAKRAGEGAGHAGGPIIRKSNLEAAAVRDGFVFDEADAVCHPDCLIQLCPGRAPRAKTEIRELLQMVVSGDKTCRRFCGRCGCRGKRAANPGRRRHPISIGRSTTQTLEPRSGPPVRITA